jgi:hypothetical protein
MVFVEFLSVDEAAYTYTLGLDEFTEAVCTGCYDTAVAVLFYIEERF